jgi:hypothetical protein
MPERTFDRHRQALEKDQYITALPLRGMFQMTVLGSVAIAKQLPTLAIDESQRMLSPLSPPVKGVEAATVSGELEGPRDARAGSSEN